MTVYEVTTIQRALMCARDIVFDMARQQNEVHEEPCSVVFKDIWNDLDDMIEILNEFKKEEFPDDIEEAGSAESNNESSD